MSLNNFSRIKIVRNLENGLIKSHPILKHNYVMMEIFPQKMFLVNWHKCCLMLYTKIDLANKRNVN